MYEKLYCLKYSRVYKSFAKCFNFLIWFILLTSSIWIIAVVILSFVCPVTAPKLPGDIIRLSSGSISVCFILLTEMVLSY